MMTINPLLPFFPDFVSFLIYGLVTGYLLKIWRLAKRNIITLLFFLYCYLVWIASMALLMTVQPQERQVWFVCGFALTFVKIFAIVRYPFAYAFEYFFDALEENRYQRQARKSQRQKEREHWEYQEAGRRGNGSSFQEEQARRRRKCGITETKRDKAKNGNRKPIKTEKQADKGKSGRRSKINKNGSIKSEPK